MMRIYSKKMLVVLLLIGLMVLYWFITKPKTVHIDNVENGSVSQTVKSSRQSHLDKKSLKTLEQPNKQVSSNNREEVSQAIVIAMSYIEDLSSHIAVLGQEESDTLVNDDALKELGSLQGTFDNHLSLTSLSMLQTLVTMYSVNYAYDEDSLQVFESDSDNVYQFIFTLTREDSASLNFVGNYVVGTGQLEITSMQGEPQPLEKENEKGE